MKNTSQWCEWKGSIYWNNVVGASRLYVISKFYFVKSPGSNTEFSQPQFT